MELALAKKKIRKYKNTLTTAGYGIIVLVIWIFIKSLIYINWNYPTTKEEFDKNILFAYVLFSAVELVYCLISSFIITKCGKTSKKANVPILVVSIFLLLFSITCFGFSILAIVRPNGVSALNVVDIIEDIIFLFFTTKILFSIIKLIKLEKIIRKYNDEC